MCNEMKLKWYPLRFSQGQFVLNPGLQLILCSVINGGAELVRNSFPKKYEKNVAISHEHRPPIGAPSLSARVDTPPESLTFRNETLIVCNSLHPYYQIHHNIKDCKNATHIQRKGSPYGTNLGLDGAEALLVIRKSTWHCHTNVIG